MGLPELWAVEGGRGGDGMRMGTVIVMVWDGNGGEIRNEDGTGIGNMGLYGMEEGIRMGMEVGMGWGWVWYWE